jgi:selenoprotein W-related protein
VALVPGEDGIFQVHAAGELLFCRKREGRFPELAELKRLLRDRIAPGRDLGHSEGAGASPARPNASGPAGGSGP